MWQWDEVDKYKRCKMLQKLGWKGQFRESNIEGSSLDRQIS